VADAMGVARSNLVEQSKLRERKKRRPPLDDAWLLPHIRALTDGRPSYGYRRDDPGADGAYCRAAIPGSVGGAPPNRVAVSDNGAPYTANETRAFGASVGLLVRATPAYSPERTAWPRRCLLDGAHAAEGTEKADAGQEAQGDVHRMPRSERGTLQVGYAWLVSVRFAPSILPLATPRR
jgi:hypothetical protein